MVTTTVDEPLDEAVLRGDIGRLSGHLDAQVCGPAVFGRLVRHDDPRVRYLGLVLLTERLASDNALAAPESAEFAALLPVSVAGPPEAALVLAGLYERLGRFRGTARGRRGVRPDCRHAYGSPGCAPSSSTTPRSSGGSPAASCSTRRSGRRT